MFLVLFWLFMLFSFYPCPLLSIYIELVVAVKKGKDIPKMDL